MKPIFQKIENFLNLLNPPHPISWQTLISLGLFSWAFAIFAYTLPNRSAIVAAHFSNNFAFIFFIIGFFWFQTEKRWKFLGVQLRPILVGLLISIFLFKNSSRWLFLIVKFWPVLSGILSIAPEFFHRFKPIIPPPEKRYNVIINLLIYLLITCWVNFYFYLQIWLIPNTANSYFDKELDRSMFVVRIIPQEIEEKLQAVVQYDWQQETENTIEKGKVFIKNIEAVIKNNVEQQPWGKIKNMINKIESNAFQSQLNNLLKKLADDRQWSVKVEVIPQEKANPETNRSQIGQYNLNLWLTWTGTNDDVVKIKKTCQLKQSAESIMEPNATIFAELTCEDATIMPAEVQTP